MTDLCPQRVAQAQAHGMREGAEQALRQIRQRFDAMKTDEERRRWGLTHRQCPPSWSDSVPCTTATSTATGTATATAEPDEQALSLSPSVPAVARRRRGCATPQPPRAGDGAPSHRRAPVFTSIIADGSSRAY